MARTMTVSEVRKTYPRPEGAAVQKRWRKLDRFMRAFIKRSPFLCLGTANAAGKADVSPRGAPPGFVQIHDDETLLIPDRPGNNHLDSIENIIANPNVDLIFFVPGSEEARERQAACRRGPERSRRLRAALLDEPRYGRNFSKSGRRRYGQMRKAASIRDQSDRTDVAWVDFVIMHIYAHVRSCSCTISV